MGKKLIIKGADFSANAIEGGGGGGGDVDNNIIYVEQGTLDLVYGSETAGQPLAPSDGNNLKRLRQATGQSIYLKAGQQITITGLSGRNGATNTPLRIDGAIFSTNELVTANLIHTLNGDGTNYYPFNATNGGNSCTITAPYTGYYHFAFAGKTMSTATSAYLFSPLNYSIS